MVALLWSHSANISKTIEYRDCYRLYLFELTSNGISIQSLLSTSDSKYSWLESICGPCVCSTLCLLRSWRQVIITPTPASTEAMTPNIIANKLLLLRWAMWIGTEEVFPDSLLMVFSISKRSNASTVALLLMHRRCSQRERSALKWAWNTGHSLPQL